MISYNLFYGKITKGPISSKEKAQQCRAIQESGTTKVWQSYFFFHFFKGVSRAKICILINDMLMSQSMSGIYFQISNSFGLAGGRFLLNFFTTEHYNSHRPNICSPVTQHLVLIPNIIGLSNNNPTRATSQHTNIPQNWIMFGYGS